MKYNDIKHKHGGNIMFREQRRKNKQLSIEDTKHLLINERRGVLSVIGDDNYPYGVPINYIYIEEDNKIYFHSSRIGHKVDSIKKSNKVCFTVYGNEKTKEENWAPYMQSVIIFGRCNIITNQDNCIKLIRKFANKYYPNKELIEEEIEKSIKAVQMCEIEIEHLTGKEIQEK